MKKFIKTTILEYLDHINENFIAYHGSGVKFDNFSDDFIGTGIGNAGFGYGIDGVIYYDNGENYVIFNLNNLSIKKRISF